MCSRQQGSLGSPALWLSAGDAENEVSWHRCSLLSTAHGIIVYTFSSLVFAGIAFWDEKMAQRTQPDPIQGFSCYCGAGGVSKSTLRPGVCRDLSTVLRECFHEGEQQHIP